MTKLVYRRTWSQAKCNTASKERLSIRKTSTNVIAKFWGAPCCWTETITSWGNVRSVCHNGVTGTEFLVLLMEEGCIWCFINASLTQVISARTSYLDVSSFVVYLTTVSTYREIRWENGSVRTEEHRTSSVSRHLSGKGGKKERKKEEKKIYTNTESRAEC